MFLIKITQKLHSYLCQQYKQKIKNALAYTKYAYVRIARKFADMGGGGVGNTKKKKFTYAYASVAREVLTEGGGACRGGGGKPHIPVQ